MSRSFPRLGFLARLLSATLLLVCGCHGPNLLQVTGQVRYQGKPVPHLMLRFVPAEGRSSWGVTDESGHYTLHHDRQHLGALRGRHKVFFIFKPRSPRPEDAALE